MNEMSMGQRTVAAFAYVLGLVVIAVFTWFVNAEGAWKKARKAYVRAGEAYVRECKLIAEKQQWEDAYDKEKALMPMFQNGMATDTTWLEKMDSIAATNHIFISKRQAGKEVAEGEVLELPVDVSQWEGSLEALVKFMHALENSEQGMFDISQLSIKPSSKKGYLRGSFTLNCAYMRESGE